MDLGTLVRSAALVLRVSKPPAGSVSVDLSAGLPPAAEQGAADCGVHAVSAWLAWHGKQVSAYSALVTSHLPAASVPAVVKEMRAFFPTLRCTPLFEQVRGVGVVDALRYALVERAEPLIVGVHVHDNWRRAYGRAVLPETLGAPFTDHAVLLYGADDHAGLFTVLNSWSAAFGINGHIMLSYGQAADTVFAAYRLRLE